MIYNKKINIKQKTFDHQILVTVSSSTGKSSGGIQVELEEIESRIEEYPMTRAFLQFLTSLTDTPVPAALGAGTRAPGFDPYLHYIMDEVFLKFGSRAYKNPGEKVRFSTLSEMCVLKVKYVLFTLLKRLALPQPPYK